MTKSSSCWRHPTQCLVGVCASCLRERLTELLCAEERYYSPQRCSFDSNASVPVAVPVAETGEDDAGNVVTISTLIEADQVEAEYRNGLAAEEQSKAVLSVLPRSASSVLQRTRSWSHASSRQQPQDQRRNGYVGNSADSGKSGSLARILSGKDDSFTYGEHSLPGAFEPILGSKEYLNGINGSSKFEFAETPKGHYKASSWPEIQSHKQQHQHHRRGSWIASFFGFRSKPKQPQESKVGEKSRKGLFGLRRKKKAPASATEDISCSPGKINQTESDEFEQRRREGSPPSEQQTHASYDQQGRVTNRVTPVSSNGDLYSNPRLSKMRSVNWSHHSSKPPRESWGKTLSTPLRMFTHKGNGRKSKDELDLDGYAQDEDKRSWSVSSPADLKRFHPSPALATTASYTAYYRDYGASWSLHSSPMPGKGRYHQNHRRGGRPWENREAFHAHSSPFHTAGSNTWNFYLTPLRPVRSSTSRHRN